jgi:TolA-binding protein
MMLGSSTSAPLLAEWVILFPESAAPQSVSESESSEEPTTPILCISRSIKSNKQAQCDADRLELALARKRIAELEQQLQQANERLTLRENTLINVLLGMEMYMILLLLLLNYSNTGSHPAFDGLGDRDAQLSVKKQRPLTSCNSLKSVTSSTSTGLVGKENSQENGHPSVAFAADTARKKNNESNTF